MSVVEHNRRVSGSGIILIDKPVGPTSYDCIRVLKQRLPGEKIGHAGTLDPLASGLLIIAYGQKTKELAQLLNLPKTYKADILLGVETDTDDLEGHITQDSNASGIHNRDIKQALDCMVGAHSLPVPRYAAVKQGGEPLYRKARRGETFTPPQKEMRVYDAHLRKIKREDGKLIVSATFTVGSGTYIRSLARELGRLLGTPATLAALRRTAIGKFLVEDAEPLRKKRRET